MVYTWKIPGMMPVPAQAAGEELERIYETYGALEPAEIVKESRPKDAPLHPCFEWDDAVAAEKYRQRQAGDLVRLIVTVGEEAEPEAKETRAFVHVRNTYQPVKVTLNHPDLYQELLAQAYADAQAFLRKYNSLLELRPVFDAIRSITV